MQQIIATNMEKHHLDPTLFNHVRRKKKSAQNAQNGDILRKYVDQKMSTSYKKKNNEEQSIAKGDRSQKIEERDLVAFAEFTSQHGWEEPQRDNFCTMAIAEAFENRKSAKINGEDLHDYKMNFKTKSEPIFVIAIFGIPVSS